MNRRSAPPPPCAAQCGEKRVRSALFHPEPPTGTGPPGASGVDCAGATSPYGTFDQGGNIVEWTETYRPEISGGQTNVMRGGHFLNHPAQLSAAGRLGNYASLQQNWLGIRVAQPVPEPGTGILLGLALGLLGMRADRKNTRATRQRIGNFPMLQTGAVLPQALIAQRIPVARSLWSADEAR